VSDWEDENRRVLDSYRSAYVTLCAASFKGFRDRFPKPRPSMRSTIINTDCPVSHEGK
jgi:hypothetical protein